MNNQPIDPPANANPANNPAENPDYDKPVAYDQQGRPLYAHPPQPQGAQQQAQEDGQQQSGPSQADGGPGQVDQGQHQYVHISRPMSPSEVEIPEDIMARHEQSRRRYPHLNLSKGEYIISAVSRHPIGLVQIWGAVLLLIGIMGVMLTTFFLDGATNDAIVTGLIGLGLVSVLVLLGGMVATYVYNSNRFFLTNESVIQEIQIGLFNRHEQTVSLSNIEDASYYQNNIIAHLFDYGTIRLSTEGDETTYRFNYVARPKQHIAVLNNAVEAFKNGRPIEIS